MLKNDSTLIMTAADSRHSSFGCDDTRDLTYFGEALLKDVLPHACSLNQAYTDTARIIRQREADEGEIHSNPKLFVGPKMQFAAPAAGRRRRPQLHRSALATIRTTLRRNVATKKPVRRISKPKTAQPLAVIILAAGAGKRMKSALPKVLQPLAGRPLLQYVLDTARSLNPAAITWSMATAARWCPRPLRMNPSPGCVRPNNWVPDTP